MYTTSLSNNPPPSDDTLHVPSDNSVEHFSVAAVLARQLLRFTLSATRAGETRTVAHIPYPAENWVTRTFPKRTISSFHWSVKDVLVHSLTNFIRMSRRLSLPTTHDGVFEKRSTALCIMSLALAWNGRAKAQASTCSIRTMHHLRAESLAGSFHRALTCGFSSHQGRRRRCEAFKKSCRAVFKSVFHTPWREGPLPASHGTCRKNRCP